MLFLQVYVKHRHNISARPVAVRSKGHCVYFIIAPSRHLAPGSRRQNGNPVCVAVFVCGNYQGWNDALLLDAMRIVIQNSRYDAYRNTNYIDHICACATASVIATSYPRNCEVQIECALSKENNVNIIYVDYS